MFLQFYYQRKWRRVRSMYSPNKKSLENKFQHYIRLNQGIEILERTLKEK